MLSFNPLKTRLAISGQKGIISLVSLFLIFVGIAAGVYLVSQQTDLFPKASVKNSGYTLKQYPSSDINITLFDYPSPPYSIMYLDGREVESTPSSSYALDLDSYKDRTIYVQLFNEKGREIKNGDDEEKYVYSWTINNSEIASISPYCDSEDKPMKKSPLLEQATNLSLDKAQTNSIYKGDQEAKKMNTDSVNGKKQNKDCPQNYVYIEPLSAGKTEISVSVSRSKKSSLATAVFTLTVVKQVPPPPPAICNTNSDCKPDEECLPLSCQASSLIYCSHAPCPSVPPCSGPGACVPKTPPYPSCKPRPACLDSRPACKKLEPLEGWCGGGKMCTLEARQCPDGSYVSRDPGNNCNFAACPGTKACPEDVRVCPDGSSVYRTQPSCGFSTCP